MSLYFASFIKSFSFLNYDMLLQLRMRELSIDLFSISFLSSVTSAVGSLATPFWGALSDESRSRKKVLFIAILIALAILPGYTVARRAIEFFLVATIFTFFASAFDPIAMAIFVESSAISRSIVVSVVNAVNSFGMGVGRIVISPLLNLLSVVHVMLVLFFAALTMLYFIHRAAVMPHHRYEIQRTNLQRVFSAITSKSVLKKKNLWAMYLGAFLRQLGIGGTFALIAVYLVEEVGLKKSMTILLASANPLMQVPSHFLAAWMMQKISSKYIAAFGMLTSGFGALLFAPADSALTVLLAYAVSGLGFGAFINGATNFVIENVPVNRRAEFLGLLTSVRSFGSLFGPLLAGWLAAFSFELVFVTMGSIMILGSILTFVYCQR
ncbi:MFS transporter [Pseudothermotoga sp.]|uniref:MFS transporter n=1 Tax=Pseudothermotoga sp. TaxID=2033661 RepID=UPI0031FDF154